MITVNNTYSSLSNINNIFSKKYLCKAPFVSIYISSDGSITPCCFNRTDILGNIYETPLKEILNNSKTNELKKSIKQGIFPKGCEVCKNHSENGNKANSGIITYDKFPVQENYLSVIEYELSYKCNLSCPMCKLNEDHLFVKRNNTENNKFDIIKQITPYLEKVKMMRFYGGEPFYIEEYYSIWQKVIEINPNCGFIVQTNGTILNQRVKEITSKGKFNFNMSVDSLNKQTYESIRIGANFEKSISNLFVLKKIAEKNRQTMSISVCPMRINWKDIPQILKFCNENKLYIFFNTVFAPWEQALWSLSANELSEIYEYLNSFNFSFFSKIKTINKLRWNSLLHQIHKWSIDAKKRPLFSIQEKESFKIKIINALTNKLCMHKPENEYKLSKTSFKQTVSDLLDELFIFISPSKILDEIENSDINAIYQVICTKLNNKILENIFLGFIQQK